MRHAQPPSSAASLVSASHLAIPPRVLGGAGLIPQIACVGLALVHPDFRHVAAVAGGIYATTILSFLGGMWWMQALCRNDPRWWPYGLAVAPSLVAWAALVPWLAGMTSARGALIVLGASLLLSPIGDGRIGSFAGDVPAWRRLRQLLSGGLGSLTIILATLAR